MSDFRLFRFGPEGRERPGVLTREGKRLDCSSFGEDWGPAFFAREGLTQRSGVMIN